MQVFARANPKLDPVHVVVHLSATSKVFFLESQPIVNFDWDRVQYLHHRRGDVDIAIGNFTRDTKNRGGQIHRAIGQPYRSTTNYVSVLVPCD